MSSSKSDNGNASLYSLLLFGRRDFFCLYVLQKFCKRQNNETKLFVFQKK
nr:MAG TPA: hypothetical protein [Caudoviricetes sp.]